MSGRAAPSGPPARLLLADSDPALCRVLHLAPEAHGYQVPLAGTATAALELAGHKHPDLIVLDRSLPGAAAAIRALRHAAATPILLLTWPTDPTGRSRWTSPPMTPSPSRSVSTSFSTASRRFEALRTRRSVKASSTLPEQTHHGR